MRIVRPIILSLALGFVTTVGVAWGLAAWLPQRGTGWERRPVFDINRYDASMMLMMDEHRRPGAMRRAWTCTLRTTSDPSTPYYHSILDASDRSDLSGGRLSGPAWGRAPGVLADPRHADQGGLEHATGWPALAWWYGANELLDVKGGVPLPRVTAVPGGWFEAWKLRALPLRPIWRGLAIDTAFYSGVWFMLLGGTSTLRRVHRRRRGRCPRCAYDLTGLQPGARCPECGTP